MLTDAEIRARFPLKSAEDSVRDKDWAAGTKQICESNECILTGHTLAQRKVRYAPSWLKMIDEPLVNATDQLVAGTGVTEIRVDYTPEKISIMNNGQGIPIVLHPDAMLDGQRVYMPQFLLGMLYQSGNHNKVAGTSDDLTGGINGIGAKITNLLSKSFIVETVYYGGSKRQFYLQQWTDGMSKTKPPKIFDLDSDCPPYVRKNSAQHTRITFEPDLAHFGYLPTDYADMFDVVQTRVALTCAYVKAYSGCRVWFNGVEMYHTIGSLFGTRHSTVLKPPATSAYRYPWTVAVNTGGSSLRLTVINGIIVRAGKHIATIEDQLVEAVRKEIIKVFEDKTMKFQPGYVKKHMSIGIIAQIPQPNWEGQRKDTFVIDDVKKLAGYKISPSFAAEIVAELKGPLLEMIFGAQIRELRTKSPPASDYKKYWPALKSHSKPAQCTLFILEGDSPAESVKRALKNTVGMDFHGVMTTGGVIINVRKHSDIIPIPSGRFINQDKMLKGNIFINAWYDITGMNPYAAYDPASPTYRKEIAALKYGKFVFFTDQDYDGIGNIDPLLINFVRLYFPRLIEQGYIYFFETPRTRVWLKGKIYEFYSDDALRDFLAANPKPNAVKYYKGIGSHTSDQMQRIIEDADKHIVRYIVDATTDKILEDFYGRDTTPRKVELSQVMTLTADDVMQVRRAANGMPITTHILFDAGQFQRDNIARKLISAIDGFNQSSRMIYNTARALGKEQIVVASFAGRVHANENYAHGQASLEGNIQGWAFTAPGGRQIPMFYPHGAFGSRACGGESAASPRYTSVELIRAWPLIFPDADLEILEYNFDEGKRREPKYFVPVIPMACLDNVQQPAHGWKINIFARCVRSVALQTRVRIERMRSGLEITPLTRGTLPLASNCEQRLINGKLYSMGNYVLQGNMLIVTELPYRVWTNKYVEYIKKHKTAVIATGPVPIRDKSSDTKIHIEIDLVPDAITRIADYATQWSDCIEEYFILKHSLTPHLNLVGTQGQVIEFDSYEAIWELWFAERLKLYKRRIERCVVRYSAFVTYYENLVRYIRDPFRMATMSVPDMEARLSTEGYVRIDRARLFRLTFDKTGELHDIIFGSTASYDYLIDLSDRKKSAAALATAEAELEAARLDLAKYSQADAPYTVWLDELAAVMESVETGIATQWKYDSMTGYSYA